MSKTKIEKLIAFYNDKSIEEAERLVVAKKLIPLLIENFSNPNLGGEYTAEKIYQMKMDYYKMELRFKELGSENFILKYRNKKVESELAAMRTKTTSIANFYFAFIIGALIGVIVTWFSK